MAALARVCSECATPLTGKGARAKTCSNKCRQDRSRRLRGLTNRSSPLAQAEAQRTINQIAHGEQQDAIRDIVRKELGPVVRQALTEDTLAAIRELIGLTPMAVSALHEDLLGDDTVVRQRAYQTLLRYTVGHQSIVKPEDTNDNSQMVVNFHLPRPDTIPTRENEIDGTFEVLHTCDICGVDKPLGDFEAGSDRCTECFDKRKAEIMAKFAS